MNRYISIIGGVAIVVFAALAIPSDSYGYVRDGDHYGLPSGCGAKISTAIKSVYPSAEIADVQRWQCQRTWEDADNPNGGMCGGSYNLAMSAETWWGHVQADGFEQWEPIEVVGGTVTVRRIVHAVLLDATQTAAHAPLFVDGCIRDDNEDALAWPNVTWFDIFRTATGVDIHVQYVTAEPDPEDVAALRVAKKALAAVTEE